MPESDVVHRGQVTRVEPGVLTIRVFDEPKCDGCAIASFCGQTAGSETVAIKTPLAASFAPGDNVTFSPDTSSQAKGIVTAFAAPAVIVLAVIIALLEWGADSAVAIIAGLAALAVYWLTLYLTRRHIDIKWTITKTNY